MVCNHTARIGCYRHYGNGYLIYHVTSYSKDCLPLRVETFHNNSQPYAIRLQWALWQLRYNRSNISRELARPPDQRTLLFIGRKLRMVHPHPTKFGNDRHCGSGYIVIWLRDFMNRICSKQVTILPDFMS